MFSKYGRILAVVLVLQAILFYSASRGEGTPLATPLATFPVSFGNWVLAREGVVEKETMDILKADDVLTRVYTNTANRGSASIFIAYFKSQRTGQSPHSPKNCLPGSGFEPVETPAVISIPVEGRAEPLTANQYIVSNGEDKLVVLYWYQSHGRIIASEFAAKFWLVADAMRYRRSDTAVVKVQVPIRGDEAAGVRNAVAFVQAVYPALASHLPL